MGGVVLVVLICAHLVGFRVLLQVWKGIPNDDKNCFAILLTAVGMFLVVLYALDYFLKLAVTIYLKV